MRRYISSGSEFEAKIGYSRAIVDGDWVFLAGTTGFDYSTMRIDPDPAAQCRQALRNVADTLEQAGATLADIVHIRYILPNRDDFEPCWPVLREVLGETPPAATMIVAGLLDPRMKIEIEVTAKKQV